MSRRFTNNSVSSPNAEKIGGFVIAMILSPAIIYGCGWKIIWGAQSFLNIYKTKAFMLKEGGFAIRFNQELYGMEITHRFFDSPVVSWIGFVLAVMLFFGAFSLLTPETSKNDD